MQDNSHAEKVEYIQLGETLNTPRNHGQLLATWHLNITADSVSQASPEQTRHLSKNHRTPFMGKGTNAVSLKMISSKDYAGNSTPRSSLGNYSSLASLNGS